MDGPGVTDRTMGLLKKVLDLRLQNQQVIASNIANADTPGYAPARFTFTQDLKNALAGSGKELSAPDPRHFPLAGNSVSAVKGKVIRTPSRIDLEEGNGVRIDQEMIDLSENRILYEAAVQMLNKKLGLLKYVAQDSR